MRNTKHSLFKIYDFKQEYKESTDTISHIIVTDMTVEETVEALAVVSIDINELKPFIMLPFAYKDVFDDSFRNDKKHEKRHGLHGEYHGYEDGIFELYHKEYAANLDYIEEIFAYEKRIRQEEIERLDAAMQELTEIQRRRLQMRYYEKLDVHQIAVKEQRSWSTMERYIKNVLKKYEKLFKNRRDIALKSRNR